MLLRQLGDDFVVLDIGTYVSSLYKEVRNVQMHSILQNGWGADFGDPINFLGQEVLSDDNAYYAQTTSWIAAVEADPKDYQKELLADYQEFTDLVTEQRPSSPIPMHAMPHSQRLRLPC